MTASRHEDVPGSVLRAELELLAAARARYGPLFEQLPFVAYIDRLDDLSSSLFTSRQIEPLTGYTSQEWRDDPELFVRTLHPEDRERVMAEHGRTRATGAPLSIEYRLIARDGRVVWFRDEAVVVTDAHGAQFLHGYMLDVTAGRAAEEELALRARQQEAVAELGVLALSQPDLDLLFHEALEIAAETLGIDSGSILELDQLGESLLVRSALGVAEDFVGSSTGLDSQAGYTLHVQAPIIVDDLESETRFPVSPLLSAFGARSGISCLIHGDDAPFGVIGVHASTARSYTEDDANFLQAIANVLASAVRRARVEAEMREASERFSRAFGDAPLAIALSSFDGRYLQVNAAFCELVGYSEEELLTRTFVELTHPDDRATLADLRERLLAGELRLYQLEKRYLHRDGHAVPTLLSCSVVRDVDGEPLYFVEHTEDLTERRRAEEESVRLEEQLRQAQKLEAIGRLAGGIAHDFNNLLLAIMGYTELALTELGRPDELRKDLEEIRRAAERAASLTRQLLAFSRRQVLEPEVLDVNEIVGEMELMLRRLIGEDVELVTQLEPGSPFVLADRGQVEQVIVNLALNGRDAMPDGGALTIATRTVELAEGWGADRDLPGGTYVVLSVSDLGHGMDAETQQRAFDPFFTTKEPGKGTGLGLATVHGIVRQSGGDIWVTSELGRGTTIGVSLPRVAAPAEQSAEPTPSTLPRGSETILLVEDNELVRRLVVDMLQRQGYRVLVAPAGPEAIDLFADHHDEISLLVTDLVMPKMSGQELAARLRDERPELAVLYMSGYSEDVVVVGEPGHGAFLEKPFSVVALARSVRAALDAERP